MALLLELDDEQENYIKDNRNNPFEMLNPNTIWFLLEAFDKAIKAKNETITVEGIFIDKNKEIDKLNLQPLFLDNFFNKGETIVLAAKSGVGKSWLSIELAKSPKIKRALFINIEDYNEKQVPRYIKSLSLQRRRFL
jgi:RecA-family ATPase